VPDPKKDVGAPEGKELGPLDNLELIIRRFDANDERTIGELLIAGKFGLFHECYVLEDALRERKIKGKTAIPAGRYRVIVTYSPRFKRYLPELLGVPEFSAIRIHSGNDADDTEGCILPGLKRTKDTVLESRIAFDLVFERIQGAILEGNEVWVTVINPGLTNKEN
jgi:hypothetical protein